MSFVLRMAWRETRASWGRLLFFFGCVAIGVAAIVGLRSVMQTVKRTLTAEARQLIGADLVVLSQRRLTVEQQAALDTALAGQGILARTDVVETQTMAALAEPDGTKFRMVEVRGVEGAYPFYGAPELAGGTPYSHALVAGRGAIVQPELLEEFALKVGDRLTLAGTAFTIRGVVTRDRIQRAGGMAFGPRVYVDLADLRALPILGFGSRATYQTLVQVVESELASVTGRVRAHVPRDVAAIRTWRTVEDRLGRNLTMSENYLSLVGFAMVVLGGIGVWSVTRVVVQQKIRSVAILKCLGATSGRVLATYLLQVTWLAAGGCALGVGVAVVGLALIPTRALLPLGVTEVAVTWPAAAQGALVGLLVSLLFAVVPLLEVRRVKPLLLLRADTAGQARRRDWRSVGAGLLVALVLALVAVWQADSLKAGLYVSGGLAVVGLALVIASRVLVRVIAPLSRSPRFALRHAVVSLRRPNNQTRVILLSVGLGCFFILAVRALQDNLLGEFTSQIGERAPDFVLIDVQADQVDGLRAAIAPFTRQPARFMPMMRGRVVGLDGRLVSLPTSDDVRRQGELTREYGLTFRDGLQDNEAIAAGTFWSGPLTASPGEGLDTEVSVEAAEAGRGKISVGDEMRFDVGGQILRTRVTSLRKVSWDQVQNGGFVFVLRPSPALARAWRTHIGLVEVAADPAARIGLHRALLTGYRNVSIIDVRGVLASVREIVANVTLAVTIVGAVTLVSGVLVLVGAVAMTKFERLYEAAIYRTLGAGTRRLVSMTVIEYGLLGLLAGALGAAGALGMSWALATGLFDIEWRPAPVLLTAGMAITAVLVAAVGLAASAEVLARKPLGTLREQ